MDNSNKQISMTEHLSAVLDDESGAFEQKRVLDELCSSQSLRDKMTHYALIGETMRSADTESQTLSLGGNFLSGIQDQLANEETYSDVVIDNPQINKSQKSSTWTKPLGGFALAASLAAVAVIGLQNFQTQEQSDQVKISSSQEPTEQLSQEQMDNAIIVSADKVSNNDKIASSQSETGPKDGYKQANAKTRSLLKRYVDSHMQYASTAAFVPSVRVIAYADFQ